MVLFSRSSSSSTISRLCIFGPKNSKNPNEMRIADVLNGHNDEDDGDEIDGRFKRKMGVLDSSLSLSSSTRSLISRWLPCNIMKRKKKADSGSSVPCALNPAVDAEEVAAALPEGLRRSSDLSIDSGRKHENFNYNLGMGIGLLFLLAKSAVEYNKMVKLREQMEMLFKDIKDEVQARNATAYNSSDSNNNISFSPSRCCEDLIASKATSKATCSENSALVEIKLDVGSDRESRYGTDFENTKGLSIDEMEAELVVELERLEYNWEEGSLTVQQEMKFNCWNDASSESSSAYHEEYNEPQEDNNDEFSGVCPHELERRLHELLEARQQEQIAELKEALQCAERKLREKEMELQLWKETQLAMSFNILQPCAQNPAGDSHILSEANQYEK